MKQTLRDFLAFGLVELDSSYIEYPEEKYIGGHNSDFDGTLFRTKKEAAKTWRDAKKDKLKETSPTGNESNKKTKKRTLRAKKMLATKKEYARVFDNFNLPPLDITVGHDGVWYIRHAWSGLNSFGWGGWIIDDRY